MAYRKGVWFVVTFLVLLLSLVGVRAWAVSKAELPLEQVGWLKYYSTGIGLEERSQPISGFALKLIFANPRGELLASVRVSLSGPGGLKAELTSEGPWLFLDLAPGVYRIKAQVDNRVADRYVRVKKGPTTVVYMHIK